jgi:hypothetical protein
MDIPEPVRRLAEEANAYVPLSGDWERIEDACYVVFLMKGFENHPEGTTVLRLRIEPERVEPIVEEIRALLAEHGRSVVTWETCAASTPADLHERLLKLGMTPYDEPVAAAMVLLEPPEGATSEVRVTKAKTLEEYRRSLEIAADSFGMDDTQRVELLAEAEEKFERRAGSPTSEQFLAWLDGDPVATGSATYGEHGVVMNGGSTQPAARGRGAYRALVRARWDEAVRRGTPALVTQAGSMSRPILERLGFRTISEIRILVDQIH